MLIVEDGPTLTHGGMEFGAGFLAAQQIGVSEIIDPRPAATGSIASIFQQYPHIRAVLPACGYSSEQLRDLEQTIRNAEPDVIIDASPAGIERLIALPSPVVRVRYRFLQTRGRPLEERVAELLKA